MVSAVSENQLETQKQSLLFVFSGFITYNAEVVMETCELHD